MSDFSQSQMKTLAVIPHITGALSMLGSCSILYDIWKDRRHKLKRPYYRILLGMSLFDLVSSASLSLSTLPMPEDTPYVYGARGTTQTCTAQGFFNELMLGSIFYNFVLAFYYTLSGKYKKSDAEFAERYERYLHGAAIVITLGFAVVGLPLKLYNPARLWCWIWAPPHSNKDQSNKGLIYRWIFFTGPLWILVLCVTILMGMLTFSVMAEERDTIVERNESAKSRISNAQEQDDDIFEYDLGGSSPTDTNYSDNNDGTREHSKRNDPTPTLYREESFRLERTKVLFRQASLYVGAFYISWFIPSITSIIRIGVQRMDKPPFAVLVLVCIFEPMQGFLNCLVYRYCPMMA